jgi:hypothetical protein
MASAHYFFRNYDIKQVINLVCYMTEYPHTLTSTQKITRLYRYLTHNQGVSSAGKRNGPLVKIDVIPLTIIAISESPGKGSMLFGMYLRVQLFSGKLLSIFRSESGNTWIQRC